MEDYLTQLTNYLLTQSWQIAVLVVVIAAVNLALKNRSAHVRYLLWLIVLAKCLVPPLLAIPLPILPQDKTPELTLISNVEMPAVNDEMADTVTSEPIALPSLPVTSPTIMERLARVTARQWQGFGWIVGMAAFLLFALVKAVRTDFWLWRQRKLLPAEAQTGIENLFSGLGIKTLSKVWLIEGIGQPFVWGLLRGSIYLPADFVKVNSAEHRRGVLGHELGHILRFDAAVNILQIIAQAVFWFHPFVWWANQRVRAEREKCCDEMAIARLGARVRDYSIAIVNTLVVEHESTQPVPSLAVAGPVKNIEERIKTMLRPGKKFYKHPSIVAIAVSLLLALLIVPTALVLTARAEFESGNKENKEASKLLWEAALKGDLEQLRLSIRRGGNVNHKGGFDFTALYYASRFGRREVAKVLIDNGADVNAQTKQGNTPLHEAVKSGHEQIVRLLIKRGVDVNMKNKQGYRPVDVAMTGLTGIDAAKRQDLVALLVKADAKIPFVHLAAFMGDLEKLKNYFKNDMNIDETDELGHTALHMTAAANNRGIAEFLITKGAFIEAKDRFGQTPLHYAALYGYEDMVKFLISRGADINIKNASNGTPLHTAAGRGHKDVVEVFVEHGADVNLKSKSWTPLHYAIDARSKGTAELLISRGAYVDAKDNDGRTSLHWAAHQGSTEVVQLLIEKGADVNVKDNKGFTPLSLAKEYQDKERQRIVELLLKHGAKATTSAAEKAKPTKSLHQAAADGDIEQVRSLIAKGADVNAEGGRLGWTPLQLAAGSGDRQVVAFLIAKGANVNAKNKPSQTPLLYAARYGHKDVAELLVSKGAEVNAKSGMERMPLYCAVGGRHKQIAELLLANGADVDAALLCAAWHGHMGATMFLLNKGANVAATDKEGRTPLHRAAKFCHKDTAGLLIAQGANLDTKDNAGATPAYTATTMSLALDQQQIVEMVKLLLAKGARVDSIHLAAFVGDTERVETFLEEGIDVDEKGKFGRTPLLMAAISGQKEMVIFLIRKGADVNAPDRSGFGPLHSAVVYPDYEVAKLLIENGADVRAKAPPFNTSPLLVPLLTVAMRGMRLFEEDNLDKPFRYEDGNLDTDGTDEDGMVAESIRKGWPNMRDVLKLLLEQGADVSEKGLMGMTLLHNYAAKAGIKDAVELFIAHGADVNAKDKWGWTPLHYACWKNHKDVVEFLLAKGADMNIQEEEGKTPLAVAKEEGYEEIVELLRKHGAKD